MAASWAAASAATLSLFVMLGLSSGVLLGEVATVMVVGAILAFAALTSWSYALVMAAHGHKGALVALIACGMLAAASGVFVAYTCGIAGASCRATTPYIGPAVALAAIATVAACAREFAKRRGATQWGAAVLLALPMLLHVLYAYFRLVGITATK